ncbi:post-GPI attachment to proteins factor 2-like [Lycorma delicatula]|uniref:post-GPI attachment to proteins factor 2-like n=1 Tax=Lycorma delicatula TaxID=130591 RepID=UPI003F515BE8
MKMPSQMMDTSTNTVTTSNSQNKMVVHLMLSFRQMCLVTVCLPLCGLVVCFITAYIFQPDEIHETHCRVYNIIPSISAITGVSPQRYLWRTCVAFHIGPRFLIASIYRSYYSSLLELLPTSIMQYASKLLLLCYWLNLIEIGALCGVTYISNKENYPIHEKIFIIFMLCSLSHMLVTLKLFKLVHPVMSDDEKISYTVKKFLFMTSIISTVGLMVFFAKHRLLCHDMAFSWFALCEYIIASANMAFHVTVVLDFPTEQLIVAKGIQLPVIAMSTTKTSNDQQQAASNNYKLK